MRETISTWLASFALDPVLRTHAVEVFTALPEPVRRDLMDDPAFVICDIAVGPDALAEVPVGLPQPGRGARSVALKRTLTRRPAAFVRWVIAHELAHAHLRNEGREPGEDPERAADALAAEWGYPRP